MDGNRTKSMAQKFLFETDFEVEEPLADDAQVKAEEELAPPEPTYSEAELAEARASGRAEGHASGLAEGRAETERLAAQAFEQAATQLGEIADTVRSRRDLVIHDATAVASAIIRKVAPDLIRRGAIDAIEAAIAGCLPDLAEEPRVVVRVDGDVLDAIKTRIDPMISASAFSGDVAVIADPALAASDCTVEWADGGIRHDPSRVWGEIEEILQTYLQAPETDTPEDPMETNLETVAADAQGRPERGVQHG